MSNDNDSFIRIMNGLKEALNMAANSDVRCRMYEDVYVFYTVDERGKERQVPKEQCTLAEIHNPSTQSIKYWEHYGYDRSVFSCIKPEQQKENE